MKKDIRTDNNIQNTTHYTRDRATQTPLTNRQLTKVLRNGKAVIAPYVTPVVPGL
jgi:hypothetical protein